MPNIWTAKIAMIGARIRSARHSTKANSLANWPDCFLNCLHQMYSCFLRHFSGERVGYTFRIRLFPQIVTHRIVVLNATIQSQTLPKYQEIHCWTRMLPNRASPPAQSASPGEWLAKVVIPPSLGLCLYSLQYWEGVYKSSIKTYKMPLIQFLSNNYPRSQYLPSDLCRRHCFHLHHTAYTAHQRRLPRDIL